MGFNLNFLRTAARDVEGLAVNTARLPVQLSENFSNTFANLGNRLGGGQDQTIQQNMGGNSLLNNTLGFSQATGTNRQLAGDVAQAGLYTLPGAGAAKTVLGTVAKSAAIGAGVGGASSVASAAGQGGQQNYKLDFLKGALGGAVLGGAGGAVGGVIGRLSDDKAAKIAKNESAKFAEDQLKEDVGPVIASRVAPAVAGTHDPNIVQNIVGNEVNKVHQPATPPPSPDLSQVQPATPVEGAGESAGQGATDQMLQSARNTPGEQPRGFTESVNESPSVSQDIKDEIQSAYTPKNNEVLLRRTGNVLNQGLDNATEKVAGALNSKPGKVSDQDVSNALAVAKAHDTQGDFEQATSIYQKLSEHLTAAGRTVQAASLLDSRTPEGLQYWASKTLNKAGVPLEGDLAQNLHNAFDVLKQTQAGTVERELAAGKVQEIVGKSIPSSLGDKTFAVWRAGLLTGPQTVSKIVTSHGVNSALETAKDYPGAAVDKFLSVFTGQRGLAATSKGYGGGFKEGIGDAKTYFKTGQERLPGTNSMEFRNTANFGNSMPGKFLGAYVNFVGRTHGSLYKPFYGAAFGKSLYNQAVVEAKNAGLKGTEGDDFITKYISNPSKDAIKTADQEAATESFQNQTKLGQVASAIQQKGGVLGKVVAPFTRIPSSIATQVVNYSPVGAVKTVMDGIKAAKSEEGLTVQAQRELSQGLGRSITGAGALAIGLALYDKGAMTLGYPTDVKQQQLWALEGKQPNALKVGGRWYSLGSLGPTGSVLSIGAHMGDSLYNGKDVGSSLIDGLVGGAQSIEEQSYLRGVSGAVNAINDPGRYANNFVKQTAGSIVPTLSNTLANATDKYQRETTEPSLGQSALNTLESRIPGLRENLTPKLSAFGQKLPSGETGIEKIADPFYSSKDTGSPMLIQELRRLQNIGYGEMPAQIKNKESFGGVSVNLTSQQKDYLTRLIGYNDQQTWNQTIQSPDYQQLTDEQKQTVLQSQSQAIADQIKQMFAQQNNIGPYSPTYQQDKSKSKQKQRSKT